MLKDKRFIGKFVNGVYGILLGFGFSNVASEIFTEYSLKEDPVWFISYLFITLFVIVVVCLYWWDWSENIENKVESTIVEFVIDMSILFALEFLFFVYNNPKAMALLFVVLATLNLVWVLNFLWEKHKNLTNSSGYLKNAGDKKYILQKIYSILLYLSCWLIIIGLHKIPLLENCEANTLVIYMISGLLLISFFSLNRYIAFRNRPL